MELLLSLISNVSLERGKVLAASALIVSIFFLPAKVFFPLTGTSCFFYGLYQLFAGGSLGALLIAGGVAMVLLGFYFAFRDEKAKAVEAQETLDSITQKMKRARRDGSQDE